MYIIEESPSRLVLRQRRIGAALLMALFMFLSVLMLLNLLSQGLPRLMTEMTGYQVLGWFIWLSLATGMITIGALGYANASLGMRCIFDKQSESVTIQKVRWLRLRTTTHSIYGIARAEVERNEEVRVLGIFLVLRSGERLALATLPLYAEDQARGIVRTVRQFLHAHST